MIVCLPLWSVTFPYMSFLNGEQIKKPRSQEANSDIPVLSTNIFGTYPFPENITIGTLTGYIR